MANDFERSGTEVHLPAGVKPLSCERWPEILRAEVQALLDESAPGAFLRRARGDALFVSDAIRKAPDTAAIESELNRYFYTSRIEKNLLHISPAPVKVRAFEVFSFPEITPFLRGFTPFRGQAADEATALLFSEGIKLCAVRSGAAAISAYEKRVRQRAALALRTGGGGGLFACAQMIDFLTRRLEP